MYTNSWNNFTLICGNHNDDHSIEMKLQQGPHSLFYACPKYQSIFGQNHHGKSCNNRLTLVDFENMIHYLQEKSLEDNGLTEVNLTGFKWSKKGIDYEVLEHKGDRFKVLMLNRKAISK